MLSGALALFAIKNPVRARMDSRQWGQFSVFLILTIVFSLFFGFRFPGSGTQIPFDFPTIYHSSAVMIFSLIPLALAAGFLNPLAALGLGATSGMIIGLWDTHSLFTILEYAGLGLLLSILFQQRYRSGLFEFLRHPLAAAGAVGLALIPVTMLGVFFSSSGETAVRLDLALTQSWPVIVAHFVELLAAGLVGEILFLVDVPRWAPGKISGWLPWDTSLSRRFMAGLLPVFFGTFLVLLIGSWLTAGMAARKLLENRLENLSDVAAETFPVFLQTGQSLLDRYASQDLLAGSNDEIRARLGNIREAYPFFTDLRVVTVDEKLLQSSTGDGFGLLEEERATLARAGAGDEILPFAVTLTEGEKSARIVFHSPLLGKRGGLQGVLFGYTSLETNPFTQTAIQAVQTIEKSGGQGWILDQGGRVVYHTNPNLLLTRSFGSQSAVDRFYEQINPGEAPSYVFYQDTVDRPWSVALSVPSRQVQQTALDIAIPLLAAILIISLVILFVIQRLLSQMTRSLNLLAEQASQISKGHLDQPLVVNQPDEVGQLAIAFEQMRRGLKIRLKDINSLLKVSQAAAYHPDPRRTVLPVLESFLGKNACAARAIFFDSDNLDATPRISYTYGIGHRSDYYGDLDEAVKNLLQDQPRLLLNDCSQTARLKEYSRIPGSIAAFRLQRENSSDGILWAAFDHPQQFSESDINFFTALAGQASLSVANANLFRSAEIGRQRMEAVINASPDPILIFNSENRLLMMNPAARESQQLIMTDLSGSVVDEVLTHRGLIDMIRTTEPSGNDNRELTMTGGKTYHVTVAEVKSANREVGKICLLHDVSRYKDLDTMKSEFVSTVSHEIQAPLSVMRGYIRMLDLVGETNQQQKNITQKMNTTIQQMNELVDNILNLGRMETVEGIDLAVINPVDVVEKVIARLGTMASQKGIKLMMSGSDTGMTIRTDPMLLQHALLNLVENGIKYTPNDGMVEVSVDQQVSKVIFSVKDNGFGIAPLDVQFIFEKFYRVGQRAAFRQKGTGLGLSIVKSISDRLGGKVWVESQLGKGSAFFFELPVNPGKE